MPAKEVSAPPTTATARISSTPAMMDTGASVSTITAPVHKPARVPAAKHRQTAAMIAAMAR